MPMLLRPSFVTLLAVLIVSLILNFFHIPCEEAMLHERFGDHYPVCWQMRHWLWISNKKRD